LKPVFHFIGYKRVETRRLSSYGATAFNLYRPTEHRQQRRGSAALRFVFELPSHARHLQSPWRYGPGESKTKVFFCFFCRVFGFWFLRLELSRSMLYEILNVFRRVLQVCGGEGLRRVAGRNLREGKQALLTSGTVSMP
jgi:hypothetical protein